MVEVITATVLAMVVALAVSFLYYTVHRNFIRVQEITFLQGRLAAAATTIERGLLPAGYDLDTVYTHMIARTDTVQCAYRDKYNENGCGGAEVVISFFAVGDTLVRAATCEGGSEVRRTVLTNLDSLSFTYLDMNGSSTTTVEDIVSIQFYVRMKSTKGRVGSPQREVRRQLTLPNFTL